VCVRVRVRARWCRERGGGSRAFVKAGVGLEGGEGHQSVA